jgi:[ribosomal protein S5]-alanine N-acetyltransferase
MAESRALITPRLQVLPFSEKHLTERYLGWLKDPKIVRYSQHRFSEHTLDTCRAYWRSFIGTPNYFWAIETRRAEPTHIGNLTVYVDERHGLGDIGVMIGERAYWGEGYPWEAILAVSDYLLREKGLRKMTAGTLSVNAGALAMLHAAGMAEEGRRVRHYLFNGEEVDLVHFAMFREDLLSKYPRGPFSE